MRYDLIVIGCCPSGVHGAIAAAKLRKRVALIKANSEECDSSSTCPPVSTRALHGATLLLTGYRHRNSDPDLFARRNQLAVEQWIELARQLAIDEANANDKELRAFGVELFSGHARFVSPHELEVLKAPERPLRMVGDKILIATGSRPLRPAWIPFDKEIFIDSDDVTHLRRIPKSMVVIGGGRTGLENAMIFALLGTRVALFDGRRQLLEFCDREVANLLLDQANHEGVQFRLGSPVTAVERSHGRRGGVITESGQTLSAETVFSALGRRGNTDHLNLQAAGLITDERGRLWCNEHFQTWANHVYGVGDVVGFPELASAGLRQGLRAVRHAFGQTKTKSNLLAHGLLTIPELATIGPSEEQLGRDCVPYEVGTARLFDSVRGHFSEHPVGMLKLLFHRETLELLGVHCLGESAADLLQIGESVLSFGGTIERFLDAAFDEPATSHCYQLAATNGLSQLAAPHFLSSESWHAPRARELLTNAPR